MGEEGVAEPVHPVTLSDFEMGRTEVTVAQYMAFVNETKSHYPEWMEVGSKYNVKTGTDDHYKTIGDALTNPNHPIVGISWDDAVAYCNWLSTLSGGQKRYRLPTEAEWEFAARGGTQSKGFRYAGTNDLTEAGWFSENSGSKTRPVGQKKANELGLYDMSGNVWEWCNDWYDTYPSGAQTNPKGPESGSYRVFRGGSWSLNAGLCRVSNRSNYSPGNRLDDLGFRLASSPQ